MLMWLLACADGGDSAGPSAALVATSLDVPTATRLSIASDADVGFEGEDDEGDTLTLAGTDNGDGTWSADAVGLPAGTTWTWVATWDGGTATTTSSAEAAPSTLPEVDVEGDTSRPGWFVLTFPTLASGAVAVVDHLGRYRWWAESEGSTLVTQARVSADGTAILWNAFDAEDGIHRTGFDGTDTFYAVPDTHHDFVELPDGRLAAVVEDRKVIGDALVIGDAIVVVDADGTVTPMWSTWDEYDYDGSLGTTGDIDFTHVNSLDYDAASDRWLVSIHGLDTVEAIDAQSGARAWALGPPDGLHPVDFTSPLDGQHGARFTDDGIAVFNNRETMPDLWSAGLRVSIDEASGTATQTWTYEANRVVYTPVLGNVDPLDDGGNLVAWGSAAMLTEVDAENAVVWTAHVSLGTAFGYAHPIDPWW